jgi:hypothetical protein
MRYVKLLSALLAGLVVAVPALIAAMGDNNLSLQEGLTVLGLFVPAVAVALSPANKLGTAELVKQAIEDPEINIKVGPATTLVPPTK